MDPFSFLPPSVFLKIIDYLPLKDQVRISRVNKNFQRFSMDAISKTKFLDFTGNEEICGDFTELSPEAFSKLINLCSRNLESIRLIFLGLTRQTDQIVQKMKIFSQISFPRLTEMDLLELPNDIYKKSLELFDGESPYRLFIDPNFCHEIFANIIRHAPKLKKLRICNYAARFPRDVVLEKLENLEMEDCDDETLQSMIGFCPNLQNIAFDFGTLSKENFDRFFASSPNICRFKFSNTFHLSELVAAENFWRLPLIELILPMSEMLTDQVVVKIARSFPDLEKLHVDDVTISRNGLAALKSMQKLRTFRICGVNGRNRGPSVHFDEELLSLALECPRLENIQIDAIISPTTFQMIVQHCPKIETLNIRGIAGIETKENAILFLESLVRVENRKLTVRIHSRENCKLFQWYRVKEMLSDLGSDIGQVIRVEELKNSWFDDYGSGI